MQRFRAPQQIWMRLRPVFLLATLWAACTRASAPAPAPVPLCIVDGGEVKEVLGTYSGATGDTLVNGRRFSDAKTRNYAAGLPWFESNDPLAASAPRDSYVKYGVPRTFAPGQLQRAGERHGVPVFVEAGTRMFPLP